ncbi:ABC transporter ATP-binding protein [Paenibacillus sp. J5C_2022]|uniref:staphylopine uptake ABC transporter ATP-binding protein CntD n=1 Tax=Paenibacillus sp. J5C2022 TaxID=2977129 RepID=UPI0021D0D3A8|nr:ABC transporter ATP-binding protein [Paenibacillus sp. J5C2022]MCU6711759.1 ABC transporter ATP-binding protein [Paenibacillus sp. J5C2022]
MNLLEVGGLKVWERASGHVIVRDVSFSLKQGECLAIVGESGSGKSLTCRTIMRLQSSRLAHSGRLLFKGMDLNALSARQFRKLRGRHICMIMQNGMRAFDPSRAIGVHLRETIMQHYDWSHSEFIDNITSAMASVMLKEPLDMMRKYPYQLSGGTLQRVMIALAIALKPDLIIADEPTTALDTITQYEVIEQFMKLRERIGCSMIFVSHDLGVVRKIGDHVLVMKDGEVVEQGSVSSVYDAPRHAYTKYLLTSRAMLRNHFRQVMGVL